MTDYFTSEDLRDAYNKGWENAKKQDETYIRLAYEQGESRGSARMLEQVIEYLENDLEFVLWSNAFMDKFKKAMRPQEDNS